MLNSTYYKLHIYTRKHNRLCHFLQQLAVYKHSQVISTVYINSYPIIFSSICPIRQFPCCHFSVAYWYRWHNAHESAKWLIRETSLCGGQHLHQWKWQISCLISYTSAFSTNCKLHIHDVGLKITPLPKTCVTCMIYMHDLWP